MLKNQKWCSLRPGSYWRKEANRAGDWGGKGTSPFPLHIPPRAVVFFLTLFTFSPNQEACSQANNERVILTVWRKYCGETTQKKLSPGGGYLVWRTTKRRWIILPLSLHNVRVCGRNSMVWTLKWNLFSSTFTLMILFITNFWVNFLYEILWCDHSNETSSAVL